jgi:glycosyltransferase involved in cell wall biosynthesis
MNILVWCSWVAHPAGGLERIALEIARQLHARGHRVVLVGPYENSKELRQQIPANMPYYPFDVHRRWPKPHFAAGRLLSRLVAEHSIQLVSAHGSVMAPYRVCKRRDLPFVLTLHGLSPQTRQWGNRLMNFVLARVFMGGPTQLVAVSAATAQVAREQFPKLDTRRLQVIHNAATDEAGLLALPLRSAAGCWHLGFIGRLVERKRPLDLVEIARQLRGTLEFKLHVFGQGPLMEPLRAAVRRENLDERFVLHGYWDQGSPAMLEQLHLLVHTDSMEPFGGALLEAQLSGRPVVAYRVGGNPEIVAHGQTGWLAPLGDTKGIAEGVRLVTSEGYAAFCEHARKRAAELFPRSKMIDKYEDLFLGLCALR